LKIACQLEVGKLFSIEETSAPMNSSIKDTLDAILARMDQMDQRLQEYRDQDDTNCRKLATRLDMLETNRRRTPDPLKENEFRANNRSPRCRQAQRYYTEDTDA